MIGFQAASVAWRREWCEAIAEERVHGVVSRSSLVDESDSIAELVIPSGSTAGTGHRAAARQSASRVGGRRVAPDGVRRSER